MVAGAAAAGAGVSTVVRGIRRGGRVGLWRCRVHVDRRVCARWRSGLREGGQEAKTAQSRSAGTPNSVRKALCVRPAKGALIPSRPCSCSPSGHVRALAPVRGARSSLRIAGEVVENGKPASHLSTPNSPSGIFVGKSTRLKLEKSRPRNAAHLRVKTLPVSLDPFLQPAGTRCDNTSKHGYTQRDRDLGQKSTVRRYSIRKGRRRIHRSESCSKDTAR